MDELIANFCAVSAADSETAKHFLAAAENDLDTAISLYLDNNAQSSTGNFLDQPESSHLEYEASSKEGELFQSTLISHNQITIEFIYI